ncbi:MAG: cob(I)yrinic acid a,c-diamide adenosyltransferase [Patescibacteria group bacterium]|nr:cob(I)yrinic acid a,c-diamide adenosyltransferase [Patescibacteria group bacterium]
MLYVLTGNGKGKTTSALGTALRSLGHGQRVVIIQFLKNWDSSGEVLFFKDLGLGVELHRFGREDRRFVNPIRLEKIDFELAEKAMRMAYLVLEKQPDLLILDEINVALKFELLKLETVLEFLDRVPKGTHVLFTGRGAHSEIINRADLVTEMKEIKHPYQKGLKAQKGLDY